MKLKSLAAVALVALAGAFASACGSSSPAASSSGSGSGSTTSSGSAVSCSPSAIQSYLYQKGQLTVATDSPAYWPWFYKNNPSDGVGYESAVAYGVAAQLGFKRSQVHWVVEPFDSSYAPGPKHFDFDVNEISVTPERASEVTFSTSYYDVQQALVVLKGTPIVTSTPRRT